MKKLKKLVLKGMLAGMTLATGFGAVAPATMNVTTIYAEEVDLRATDSTYVTYDSDLNEHTVIKTYSDSLCTAEIYEDGVSGKIVFKDPAFWDYTGWRTCKYVNNIGGTPLSQIIKFNDGGYIREISGSSGTYYLLGAGPCGWDTGYGHVKLTDKVSSRKEGSFWYSTEHYETIFFDDKTNSDSDLCGIEWWS